jgi:hypothetical protein
MRGSSKEIQRSAEKRGGGTESHYARAFHDLESFRGHYWAAQRPRAQLRGGSKDTVEPFSRILAGKGLQIDVGSVRRLG